MGAVTGHWTPHPSLGHLSNRPDSHSWEKARIWGTPPETRPSVLESGPFGDGILCNIVHHGRHDALETMEEVVWRAKQDEGGVVCIN